MAIFKCKMCGGSLEVEEGASYGICEYCGTTQTLPTSKDETLQNLFNRANTLRKKAEFDKASELYEKILQVSDSEAEAYWGLILCKYGVEYVEDPATFKRVPTCHRASYDAVTADEDYKNALNYADPFQKTIYEEEASAIEKIQQGIISVAQKEDPYDVFICYKETDENGRRTPDSALANDVYYHLKREGFKVFYAAITLEDKLGTEYEPYIFSALNTAKVMLAIGTKPEYFNAVWVKNEWSRFLKIIKKDRTKLLIPCYRDMDPYELPEEFAHLQAQDMSKIGFINDLVRGIKKVIVKEQANSPEVVVQQTAASTSAIAQIKRGNMALEDHDWAKADDFFEEALNIDPESAEAYIGKLMADKGASNWEELLRKWKNQNLGITLQSLEACPAETKHIQEMTEKYAVEGYFPPSEICNLYEFNRKYESALSCRKDQKKNQLQEISSERLLNRAKQFAKGNTKKQIEEGLAEITAVLDQRIEYAQKEDEACIAKIKEDYANWIAKADLTAEKNSVDAKAYREKDYQNALEKMRNASGVQDYQAARDAFLNPKLKNYKDCKTLAESCQKEIDRIEEERRLEEERQTAIRKAEKERQDAIRKAEEDRQAEIKRIEEEEKAKKTKKMIIIVATVAAACVAAFLIVTKVVIPNNKYNAAVKMMENGDYASAVEAFKAMDGYKDSANRIDSIYKSVFGEEKFEQIKNIKAGDTYVFGTYEQDDNASNGAEDIEWIVLDKNGYDLLLISKYALDCQPYHESLTSVTWETCSLREWLNASFISSAFNSEEVVKILTSQVTADRNPEFDTSPGNNTMDQVFLLSIPEAERYFNTDKSRTCKPSAFAKNRGAKEDLAGNGCCWWWLRSPGCKSEYAANIYRDEGNVYENGDKVDDKRNGVRPALWIDPLWID